MKDWNTNPRALERGARSGPVGTPNSMIDCPVFEVRHELRRELVGIHPRCIGKFAVSAECHEVIAERDDLAIPVEPGLEEMEACRPVEVMLHVILAVPQQLHRRADLL